ncbi:MAG TPA: VOC family protein [Anaerolineae bacterium]|nr:VOC family protein [Anaerolineae bacterium]
MSILGFHHITLVASNAQQTVDFYTRILGLRLVKKTVNFDAPNTYHLYFGDETGTPGTLLTFFEWPNAGKGQWGIGATHHLALTVETAGAQLMWKRWLTGQGVPVAGPYDRSYFRSIYFTDPDGLILEIATRAPGWAVDELPEELGSRVIMPPAELMVGGRDEAAIKAATWLEPVVEITPEMQLAGLHHITAIASDIERTHAFYTEVLGLRLLKRTVNFDNPQSPHTYWGVGEGRPGTIITYFGYSPAQLRYGELGIGLTHHFAFAVKDEATQREWHARLRSQGLQVTPVLDRKYFKSIYFNDPDGHILEIATLPPGFMVDEEKDQLGSTLALPAWLEPQRATIESELTPIST